jgi:hypothetical protein
MPRPTGTPRPQPTREPREPRQPTPDPTEPTDGHVQGVSSDAGRDLAYYYVQRHGWCEAYIDGANHALYRTLEYARRDDRLRDRGRREGENDSRTDFGKNRGERMGVSTGATDGASQAFGRFRSVVDTGQEPDLDSTPPRPVFEGIRDGYEHEVGPAPSLREYMRRYPFPERAHWDRYGFYECDFDPWDDMYNPYPRDPWHDRPWRDWYESDRAFERWVSWRAGSWYHNLNPRHRDMARQYFRHAFQSELDRIRYNEEYWWRLRGQDDGEDYGRFIAEMYYHDVGFVEGFNERYRRESIDGFFSGYADSYRRSFDDRASYLSNNSELDFSITGLTDANNNNNIEPGEGLNASIALVNYGRKAASLVMKLAGDLLSDVQKFVDEVTGSSTLKNTEFRDAAKVVPGAPAGSKLLVQLDVNGKKSGVYMRKPGEPPTVEFPVQLTSFVFENYLVEKASGLLNIKVVNKSTDPTSSVGVMVVKLVGVKKDGTFQKIDDTSISSLQAGQVLPVTLKFGGLSPLEMIRQEWKISVRLENSFGMVMYERALKFAPTRDDAILYLLEMGRSNQPNHPEWQGTSELILAQVQSEWGMLSKQKGNPYEADLKAKDGKRDRTLVGRMTDLYLRNSFSQTTKEPFTRLKSSLYAVADKDKNGKKLKKAYHKLVDGIGK